VSGREKGDAEEAKETEETPEQREDKGRMAGQEPIKHYKDFLVYQQSYQAALSVSKLTRTYPRSEQFGLAHQMRTAARSVPANIAEGWARRESAAEFRRFLQMAIGSCEEMKVWLDFSRDEGYANGEVAEGLQAEYARIGALLYRLWKSWRKF
jgi:four helix bundle protein